MAKSKDEPEKRKIEIHDKPAPESSMEIPPEKSSKPKKTK